MPERAYNKYLDEKKLVKREKECSMKIYGMMLVKDEADILRECIQDALRWVDGLFIIDNGSTDGSWEIIQSMKSDQVVPWKQIFTPYRRTMRAEIFAEFRHISRNGDWWFFADADEFYVDNPKEFLANVPKSYHVVFKKSIDYRLTEEDVKEYTFTGDFSKDKENIRYIEPICWAETRFFRYREKMEWDLNNEKPLHIGVRYPKLIIVRHYRYRSPQQIQHRLDIRNKIPRDKEGRPFRHVNEARWEEALRKRSELVEDRGYDQYLSLPIYRNMQQKTLNRIKNKLLYDLGLYK